MNPPFLLVAPDRFQIREGGGCMSVFGIPFFAAGVFLILTILGVVPVSNASDLPGYTWAVLVLMSIAFTVVGGALVFGRSWTTIDRSRREVIKQWGLLIPLHERIDPLHGYGAITLGFIEGDSDTADRFPVALKAQIGPDLPLCSFTVYAQARECARAVADHLRMDVEDASTDHPVRLPASLIDIPFHDRVQREGGAPQRDVDRPPGARSQVTRNAGAVTIVIPSRRTHPLALAAVLIPITIMLVIGPPLATFLRESQTPDPVAWAFLGFLTLFFGILPTMWTLNAFLRSRHGATIIEASKQGLRIQERAAWATHTIASLDASDILDVDFSSRESSIASAKRAAEQTVLQSYPSASATVGPRIERMASAATHYARGRGVTVKTRKGLTTFGEGLDDAEIRYLHSVVRRALIDEPFSR